MTWQEGTTAATDSYRDLAVSLTAVATSQHVSAILINAAGSGYTQGDLLTITHAGAYHDCILEVTSVDGGGAILAARIRQGGAFSNRVATVAVNASGSGYAVGDVLEIQGGTSTEKGKAQVTGLGPTTVALFETGGAYTTPPGLTGAATVGIGPAGFAGDDNLTVDLTMTGLVGTTGVSASGGTGTGATFDITLTASGWAVQASTNDQTINSLTDEKLVVLLGTVSGGDAPYVALLTYTQTSGLDTNRGIAMFGMTAFNPALSLAAQPGVGPLAGVLGTNTGSQFPVHEAAREWGFSVKPRRLTGWVRTTDVTVCYATFYLGLMNGLGTSTTSPYPMFVGASSNVANQRPDSANLTGLSECFRATTSGNGPNYFRRKSDGSWVGVVNGQDAASPQQAVANNMWPVCAVQEPTGGSFQQERIGDDGPILLNDGQYGSNVRANATDRILPAPNSGDDVTVFWPLTVLATNGATNNTINVEIAGELDDVYWFPGSTSAGATVSPDDHFDHAGVRYRIIPNGTQGVSAKPYQFTVFAER